MQVKAEQLESRMEGRLMPVIWIAGDEALLVQESCDLVRKKAADLGYTEREVFNVQSGFDWNRLLEAGNSLSLFSERKVIDIRLPSAKLDNTAKAALHAYVENPGDDNLLLISSPRIDKAATNTKWFKAIENKAFFVPIWPVTTAQMPAWIRERLGRFGMTADAQAVTVLVQRVEGNLLAAAQEVEKLSLLVDEKNLDVQTVARAVADSSRFNVFGLVDASLAGDAARALNILYHLRAEGTELMQIMHFMTKEIRTLCRMAVAVERGLSVSNVMQSERVWRNRIGPVSAALEHHGLSDLEKMLNQAWSVDQAIKGLSRANPWDELTTLVLQLANTPVNA